MRQAGVGRSISAGIAIAVVGAVAFAAAVWALERERVVVAGRPMGSAAFGGSAVLAIAGVSLLCIVTSGALRMDRPGRLRQDLATLCVVAAVAVWAGYAAGVASAWAAGPAQTYRGSVLLRVSGSGWPAIETPAICQTIVGDPARIADVHPTDASLGHIDLRDAVRQDLAPAWVPPLPTDDRLVALLGRPSADFRWEVVGLAEDGGQGTLTVVGDRPGGVPITLRLSWTCDVP